VEKDKKKEGRKITGKGEKYLTEKAKHVASITGQELKKMAERKAMKEMERKKKTTGGGEEKKEAKREKKERKKKKETKEVDITAVKLKKQSKK